MDNIYVAISIPNSIDMGKYFDQNQFLVMNIFDTCGNIVDNVIMTGFNAIHIK